MLEGIFEGCCEKKLYGELTPSLLIKEGGKDVVPEDALVCVTLNKLTYDLEKAVVGAYLEAKDNEFSKPVVICVKGNPNKINFENNQLPYNELTIIPVDNEKGLTRLVKFYSEHVCFIPQEERLDLLYENILNPLKTFLDGYLKLKEEQKP